MRIRTVVFWLHLVSGVGAGLVILIMAATGVLLAFEPQIVEFAERDRRLVSPPPGAARLPLDAIVDRAAEGRPAATPASITLRADPGASAVVSFGRDDYVFVDPYRGALLGAGSKAHAVMQVIEDWHRWLGSRETRRSITGACNLAFFFMAVSGLYLWWPRRWSWSALRSVSLFDRSLRGRARDWNWHNAIGVWCAAVLAVIALTGVVMSYQWANDLLYRLTGNEPPPPAARAGGPEGAPSDRPAEGRDAASGPARARGSRQGQTQDGERGSRDGRGERPLASLDALLGRAQAQAPGWIAVTVRLSARPGAPVTAIVQEPAPGYIRARSQMTLDPFTAEVVKWEPFASQNAGRKLRVWARYLHTGEAGGLVGQIIACVASAGATVLVWTGLSLALGRLRNNLALWRRAPIATTTTTQPR